MTTTATERSTGGTIQIVGEIWQPGMGVCAYTYTLRPDDIGNMRGATTDDPDEITRKDVQEWVDCNADDFQHVTDFRAVIDDGPLPDCDACGLGHRRKDLVFDWEEVENEFAFNDAMYGMKD